MKHVVMFSSGIGSWAAARRVADKHGANNLTLLFTDVKGANDSPHAGEDEDNYRFLREASANIGGQLVILNEGRDIWDVFHDEHMMGNSRVAPCSKRLKQIPARKWVETNCAPADTTIYVGIDWTESHRLEGARVGWHPWRVEAPLTEPPTYSKESALRYLQSIGIEPPRLYALGFQHANCGGFCVRMGQTQAVHLLKTFPERYEYHELQEQLFREKFGKDVSFLRDRRGGQVRPLTLRNLRRRVAQDEPQPKYDWGGCGCFFDE